MEETIIRIIRAYHEMKVLRSTSYVSFTWKRCKIFQGNADSLITGHFWTAGSMSISFEVADKNVRVITQKWSFEHFGRKTSYVILDQ